MKLLLTLLLPAAILFLAGAGTDEAALREKAASMAAEAKEELGLSAEETTHLRELFFEKLDKTERLTRGVADPAERSQIAKRIIRNSRKSFTAATTAGQATRSKAGTTTTRIKNRFRKPKEP